MKHITELYLEYTTNDGEEHVMATNEIEPHELYEEMKVAIENVLNKDRRGTTTTVTFKQPEDLTEL